MNVASIKGKRVHLCRKYFPRNDRFIARVIIKENILLFILLLTAVGTIFC